MGRNGNSLGMKLLTCVMSVVLAIGLMPLPAYAGEGGSQPLSAADFATGEGGSQPLAIGNLASGNLLNAGTSKAGDGIAYVNAAGEDMEPKSCVHVNRSDTNWTDQNGTNGWYALTTTLYFNNPIQVNGTVNLILCDSPSGNYTLIADKGIVLKPGSHLIIWAQGGGTGKIQAYGVDNFPGIGSNASLGRSGNLTINGGAIVATGGINAPGLGSCGSDSGIITINGGRVNATGGHAHDTNESGAPGIGANDMPDGTGIGTMNNIYFYGGETKAFRGAGNYYPIGDKTNSTGSIYCADGMEIKNAGLNENGRLTSNPAYIEIKPKDNAGPAYTVGTDFDATLGTVTTSLPMARSGEEITVTAVPEPDCRLVSLTVTDRNDQTIAVSDGKFTMPSASVTVNAEFASNIYPITVSESRLGKVAAPKEAKMNTTVALTVMPDVGCSLSSLTITDSEGAAIPTAMLSIILV